MKDSAVKKIQQLRPGYIFEINDSAAKNYGKENNLKNNLS
jgi:hypothetical protein